MADLDLSSTSGDRIQAGKGKRCLKFQGKKADLKVEKADLKQSPLIEEVEEPETAKIHRLNEHASTKARK